MVKTRTAVLIEVSPLDPSTGERVTLRFCDADRPKLTGLGGFKWWPGVAKAPTLNRELFNGSYEEAVAVPQAALSINFSALRKADANAPLYRFAAASMLIYSGPEDGTWDDFALLFRGSVVDFSLNTTALSLTGKVNSEPFEGNTLETYYAGSGGAEGGEDLKDKSKPAAFGYPKNIEPVLIDTVNNVFQVHGYGPIEDVVMVYERAAAFGASLGDHASYAALVAASVPEGQWATCKAQGLFRLGAPPAGLITADVKGDNVGGWHRSTAQIIQRICDITGVASSDNVLPDDSFAPGSWNLATTATRMAANSGGGFALGNADYTLDWIVPTSGVHDAEETNVYPDMPAAAPRVTYFGSVDVQKNAAVLPGTYWAVGVDFHDVSDVVVGHSVFLYTSDVLVAGDAPKTFNFSVTAPADAAFIRYWLYVSPTIGASGTIRFEAPRLSRSPLDLNSLVTFEEEVPFPISVYLTAPERTADLIGRLVRPCNAQATLSWLGLLQITRFSGIAPASLTLDVQGRQMPPVLENSELNVSPPFWRMEMAAERSWRVQSPDEIASA